MMLKAFSATGRNSFEIAIITLSVEWLKKTMETTEFLATLNMESYSGYVARQEHDVPFLFAKGSQLPFYEQWLNEDGHAFIDAEAQEIEQVCRHFKGSKSDSLVIHSNGMAYYETANEPKLRTVDFDLKLIHEILTHQN